MIRRLAAGYRSQTALLLVVAFAACTDRAETPFGPDLSLIDDEHVPRAFTVYTQNVYLGGDTGPIFALDFSDIPALVAATNVAWAEILASDIPERVTAVVDEIDARRPHLVGLQEVFQFVELELGSGTPTVVTFIDILASIEAEITARGLPYEVVAVQENTSTGSAFGMPLSATRILQFTDRIAALRRTDVPVTAIDHGTYAASMMLGPLALERGWIRLTTDRDGIPHHFVTTHLEIQALAALQVAQADELINGIVAGLDGVTIVAGDLNSDPEPTSPYWTPTYGNMITAGFTDAWEQAGQSSKDPGFTCCQDAGLRNGPSLLDRRIDFVLVRRSDNLSSGGMVPGSMMVEIVGEEQEDRTPTNGLWPADHAGVVATLMLAAR